MSNGKPRTFFSNPCLPGGRHCRREGWCISAPQGLKPALNLKFGPAASFFRPMARDRSVHQPSDAMWSIVKVLRRQLMASWWSPTNGHSSPLHMSLKSRSAGSEIVQSGSQSPPPLDAPRQTNSTSTVSLWDYAGPECGCLPSYKIDTELQEDSRSSQAVWNATTCFFDHEGGECT